ncbi:hypothetical protein SLS60_003024 [Paraconiothyrium brasiliense]|uniref:Zn(2)-C6 fungal-type domain-containing protein n=1 Tax=Paraconiothyrium brasiliense TaxID=300254 RepID=A0ABR3RUJ9_9PLEO
MGDRSLEGAGSENGVELWLEALNIEADHEGTRQKMTTTTPSTPRTKPLCLQRTIPQLFEEISPTDTNFSSDIVFDSPLSPSCNATLNPRWDTDTEASSLDDEDEARVRKELFCSVEKLDSNDVKPTIQSRASAQDLTTPLKHPLHGSAYPELTSDVDSLPRLVLDFDPEANHLICLSSCLQCVLSDLRCSRTLPSCSRCIRNGHGELCLAQRKRLHVEVFDEDDSVDTDPILLKVEGDDNDTYDKKFKLQDDVRYPSRLDTLKM